MCNRSFNGYRTVTCRRYRLLRAFKNRYFRGAAVRKSSGPFPLVSIFLGHPCAHAYAAWMTYRTQLCPWRCFGHWCCGAFSQLSRSAIGQVSMFTIGDFKSKWPSYLSSRSVLSIRIAGSFCSISQRCVVHTAMGRSGIVDEKRGTTTQDSNGPCRKSAKVAPSSLATIHIGSRYTRVLPLGSCHQTTHMCS